MNIDRRDIAPFLLAWFPTMGDATSEEWHFFLDKITNLETPLEMPNAQAFDRWRIELAKQGFPAFPYSPDRVASMKSKANKMVADEQERAANLGKTLADLAKEAPNWPVSEIVDKN